MYWHADMRESLQLALHMGLECTQQLMVRCTAGNLRMAEGMGMYVQQWACMCSNGHVQ